MLLNFILQRNFTTVGAPEKSFYQSLEKSTIAPPPEKILRRPWIGIYFVSNALAHVLLKDADKFQESYRCELVCRASMHFARLVVCCCRL